MASTILILGVAILCAAFAWRLVRTPPSKIRNLSDWEAEKYDIDVQVLRNLLDSGEERYLRTHLPRPQFNFFQRKRIHLTLNMLKMIEANAAMLMRLGHLARMNGDQDLRQRGDELIVAALQLRRDIHVLRFCLTLKLLFPAWSVGLPRLEVSYRELMHRLIGVQQYRRPAFP